MNKIALAVSILTISAVSASAADMAARYNKAPAIAPVTLYDWSGLYIGINGGGGSAHSCSSLLSIGGVTVFGAPVFDGCNNGTGGTIGGQVGYRWQSAAWVFGLEAQGNWADFKGSNPSLAFPAGNSTDTTNIQSFGLFTGQIGYAVNNVLFYAKGGAAVTNHQFNIISNINGAVPIGAIFAAGSETRWGGVAGGGIELGFSPNWSVSAEYDHLFMGTQNITLIARGGRAGIPNVNSTSQDVDIGTVRLNYKFGGPVVARY